MIKLKLSYPPTANHIWKSGGGRVYRSARYVSWQKTAMAEAIAQKPKPVAGAYHLNITAYRPDKRKRDVDNLIKVVSDFAQRAGLVEGDHLAQSVSARWAESEGDGIELEIKGADA